VAFQIRAVKDFPMFRIHLAAYILASCLMHFPIAAEQIGLQPGWVEQSRVEVSTPGAFSAWNDPVTVSLAVESQGPPLIVWGDSFFTAHGQTEVMLQQNYPDVLPRDAEVTEAKMYAEYISATTAVELGAKISEIGTYFSGDFSAYGPEAGNVWINTKINVGRPIAWLEYRLGEGMPVQIFDPWGESSNLSDLTDSPDMMNLTFKARVTTYDPLNASATIPAPGVQFRARYKTVLKPSYEEVTFYLSPWFESDDKGEVEINVGGGGAVVEPLRDLHVNPPFAGLAADGGSVGYCESRLKIEDLWTFKGTLRIRVKDPRGRPVTGVRLILQGAVSAYGEYSDSAGEVEIEVNGGGTDTRTVDVTVAPRMILNNSLTQIVDDVYENQLHSDSPAYYVAKFAIDSRAVNYLAAGDSFGDFTLNIYENDVLAAEITGLTAKCAAALTPDDHANSVNAYFYGVLPEASSKTYRHQIVWEDGLGDDVPLSPLWAPRSISEQRIPARERPFRVHYVGIDTEGAYKAHGRGVMTTWASPGRMSRMNDYFLTLFPGPVEFTYGPDLRMSEPWYTFGPYRVISYFVDLARLRESIPDRPDLIVGVSAAGVIGADGLSEPRFREVILLDGTGMRESYLLHEFMHTLGLLDNYNYETGEGICGASANGFDPRAMRRIYNSPGVNKPPHQTVMYDRAPSPWLTNDDYSVLLDEATMAIIENTKASAQGDKDLGMEASLATAQEVMLIGGTYFGRQTWTDYQYTMRDVWPIFVDTDVVWQPHEGVSPSALALGVRLSNGQTASVREDTYWRWGAYDQQEAGNLVTAPLFKIPYDSAVNTVVFESYHRDDEVRTLREVTFSPHAPTVSIISPATGTRLAGNAPLVFQADDVDAGEQLYAWVKVSGDGGATWTPVGNWFPIPHGQNTFAIPCNDFPAMDEARLRVLISDGTRSARVDAGSFAIEGYAGPQAKAEPAWHELTVRTGSRYELPVRINNTGRAALDVTFDDAAAPPWLGCRQVGVQTIAPGGSFEFLIECATGAAEELSTNLLFNTNDPQRPVLTVSLKLHVVDTATAPVVASVTTDPPAGAGERVAWEGPVRFVVREAGGRPDLAGRIDIHNAETGDVLANVDLSAEMIPNLYQAAWTPPAECFGIPLGIEATLTDGGSGMSSSGGSNPLGWDTSLQLMRRNTAPRFINPAGNKEVVLTFPQTLEIPFEVVDDEGDPISFSVEHGPELDVRLDAQARMLRVSFLTDVPYYLPRIRLAATDQWGATSGVVFTVSITWQNTNYGYLAYLTNFMLESDPMPLVITGSRTSETPQKVVIDYRPEGAADWIGLGEYPFTRWDDLKNCWLADCSWDWPNDGTAAFELRVTLIGSDGSADPEPPVYRFERPRQGGRVTRVESPAVVNAGAEMILRVHVENGSSDRWSGLSGFGLRALDGIDPLTGLATAEFMGLQQIERGSTAIVEIRTNAPATPGVYRTAWGLRAGSTPFGEGAETWVQVVPCAADASEAATLIDVLLGRISIQSLAPGSLDLNGDGKIDVADLVTMMNRTGAEFD